MMNGNGFLEGRFYEDGLSDGVSPSHSEVSR